MNKIKWHIRLNRYDKMEFETKSLKQSFKTELLKQKLHFRYNQEDKLTFETKLLR